MAYFGRNMQVFRTIHRVFHSFTHVEVWNVENFFGQEKTNKSSLTNTDFCDIMDKVQIKCRMQSAECRVIGCRVGAIHESPVFAHDKSLFSRRHQGTALQFTSKQLSYFVGSRWPLQNRDSKSEVYPRANRLSVSINLHL